jgi:hypothetical protein
MLVNITDMIERAMERAFAKALQRTLRTKAEALFAQEFEKVILKTANREQERAKKSSSK